MQPPITAPNPAPPRLVPDPATTQTVVQTAAEDGRFKTFLRALDATGLRGVLSGPGPFTVFAPTDAAFAGLPRGKLDALMTPESCGELAQVLRYHVVQGRSTAAQVAEWGAARTLLGVSAPVRVMAGQLTFDGARVSAALTESRNGILHSLDKVCLPPPLHAGAPRAD
jgi:uncharacterized surface protein with fasciclin (FAS1) repeats